MTTIRIEVTDTLPANISLWTIINTEPGPYFAYGNDIESLMKYVATYPGTYKIPRLPVLLDAINSWIDRNNILCVSNYLGHFAVRLLNPETQLHTISIFLPAKIDQIEGEHMNDFNLLVKSDATDSDIKDAERAIKMLFQYDKVNVYRMDVTLPMFAAINNTVYAMNFYKEREHNEEQI